jgi:hypothetical protein
MSKDWSTPKNPSTWPCPCFRFITINKRVDMKFLTALFFLVIFTACNSKSSSTSKKCTYNDEPIDCSQMNPEQAGGSTSLFVHLTSKIRFSIHFIEIQERNTNFINETINGSMKTCVVSTKDVVGYGYRFDDKTLQLRANNELVIFNRIEGDPSSELGKWENTIEEVDHTRITTIVLTENQIEIFAECKFNN